MQHLTCFYGGLLALSTLHLPANDTVRNELYMTVAKGVGEFCKYMYDAMPVKLSPESVDVNGNQIMMAVRFWIMRPEAIETWYVLWRLTHNPIYRQWAWEVFQTIQSVSKKTYGYSGLSDASGFNFDNVQQSFFLAETLKYLYLIFCPDDYLPFSEFVLNTEAHPFPLFDHWKIDIFGEEFGNGGSVDDSGN